MRDVGLAGEHGRGTPGICKRLQRCAALVLRLEGEAQVSLHGLHVPPETADSTLRHFNKDALQCASLGVQLGLDLGKIATTAFKMPPQSARRADSDCSPTPEALATWTGDVEGVVMNGCWNSKEWQMLCRGGEKPTQGWGKAYTGLGFTISTAPGPGLGARSLALAREDLRHGAELDWLRRQLNAESLEAHLRRLPRPSQHLVLQL